MRTKDLGQYTVAFARLAAGTDLGPALVGLPDDLCPCPHWGYMVKGRLLMRTPDGDQVYEAGPGVLLGARPRAGRARGLRVRRLLADRGVQPRARPRARGAATA